MKLILVGLVAAVAVASAQAQATAGPALDVIDVRPFVTRGTGFEANERISLLLSSGRTWSKAVVATEGGSFRARFALSLPRCGGYTLHAIGSRGSRARLRSGTRIDCEPQLSDR
ncbi:MAG: hypothetical protein H0W35_02935 [Actinobacteria bacterium]|nr:hypothetical protein [Actinomycetota bacterium]